MDLRKEKRSKWEVIMKLDRFTCFLKGVDVEVQRAYKIIVRIVLINLDNVQYDFFLHYCLMKITKKFSHGNSTFIPHRINRKITPTGRIHQRIHKTNTTDTIHFIFSIFFYSSEGGKSRSVTFKGFSSQYIKENEGK